MDFLLQKVDVACCTRALPWAHTGNKWVNWIPPSIYYLFQTQVGCDLGIFNFRIFIDIWILGEGQGDRNSVNRRDKEEFRNAKKMNNKLKKLNKNSRQRVIIKNSIVDENFIFCAIKMRLQ